MLDRMLLASASTEALYVEDVFSTYLWTGDSTSQTINNGIDLTGKGGMVWARRRDAANNYRLADTARGAGPVLSSSTTDGDLYGSNALTSFTSSGFTTGTGLSTSGAAYTSWTFRKAPKFFDVVTWTGDNPGDSTVRNIPHNLGVAPGCIIVKRTSGASNWLVYHRSAAANNVLILNTTDAQQADTSFSNVNSTSFGVGYGPNISGSTYVAYLFAHDPTADGVIQCGSFDNSAGAVTVNLGWEPQWLLMKNAAAAGDWFTVDNMRGMPVGGSDAYLLPNSAAAENSGNIIEPTATGFTTVGLPGSTNFTYIAIRRGPMKTPTVGTSVFAPVAHNTTTAATTVTVGFPTDLSVIKLRNAADGARWVDRMRGITGASNSPEINSTSTAAEYTVNDIYNAQQVTVTVGAIGAYSTVLWNFRRAPGFFDVVCYTGTGSSPSIQTINHNLGVAPELVLLKARSATSYWYSNIPGDVANAFLEFPGNAGRYVGGQNWSFTSTTFKPAGDTGMFLSGTTYVAYLFASCPGVSKVGSYTGNGSSQTINCGFSNGARFFLVKRTDSTGDWWVYDSARGIVAAADPALRLNSTATEVTSADAVDTDSTGIIVNQEATCNINVNGATYIYLAIA